MATIGIFAVAALAARVTFSLPMVVIAEPSEGQIFAAPAAHRSRGSQSAADDNIGLR